jgi:hypothetical protein
LGRLVFIPAVPDGTYGVYDTLGGQIAPGGGDGFSGWKAVRIQFLAYLLAFQIPEFKFCAVRVEPAR